MRIRTIKPEFWANEKLGELTYFSRLLALALLNYADDEGYFNANPTLIRGSVFPFEDDSSNIRRGIDELSNIGFLRVCEASDHRCYGWIVHFRDHQKIDRPKRSVIKPLCNFDEESTKNRRGIDSGTGNREQGTGNRDNESGDSKSSFPAELDLPEAKQKQGKEKSTGEDLCELEDWLRYADEIGFPRVEAKRAYDAYSRDGWTRAGKRKGERIEIKSWKGACRTCLDHHKKWAAQDRRREDEPGVSALRGGGGRGVDLDDELASAFIGRVGA